MQSYTTTNLYLNNRRKNVRGKILVIFPSYVFLLTRCCSYLFAWCRAGFSQPLSTVFKSQLLEISLDFSKHGELFRKIHSYCQRSWTVFSQPYSRCSRSNSSTIRPRFSKYGKLFRDFLPYCSGQSALFTTFIHGVQRLASSTISLNRWKTWEAVFLCSFLLLDADQPFHNLIYGVQRADLQQ